MKIAILGGGVAGISSAIALTQKGFEVEVYERHATLSTIGAGIVVWPNAAFILEQLGVLREIETMSGQPKRMLRLTNKNEYLGAIDIDQINQQMGYASFSILRNDLQTILQSKLNQLGILVHYDHEVSTIKTNEAKQAQVEFINGCKISPDIVIGADGRMNSHARQYVHQNNAAVYQGFINWIGVYKTEKKYFHSIEIRDYWGVGERFGIVPIDSNRAYWAGAVACDHIGERNSGEYKEELSELFSTWPDPVQEMINRTPMQHINKIYVHDHSPIRTWHKDNLIIIGDAAHAPLPTSGQGACQALEDAWYLANCLESNPSNLHQAFSDFTNGRFEKTKNIINAARGFAASLFNRDESFCEKRDENSRRNDYAALASAMANAWSQGLPLPIKHNAQIGL
ncbi:MAG: FAD-dependent monooxygenase [Gammaproteobacteria bacterium]|nr:FAD-dependent monooxygenase [Gammaproteobacteria bacterium]